MTCATCGRVFDLVRPGDRYRLDQTYIDAAGHHRTVFWFCSFGCLAVAAHRGLRHADPEPAS